MSAPPLIFAEMTALNPHPRDWRDTERMLAIKQLLDLRERARTKLAQLVALCGNDRGFDIETCQQCDGKGKGCDGCFETGRADIDAWGYRDFIEEIEDEIQRIRHPETRC